MSTISAACATLEPVYDLEVVTLKVVDKKASEHPAAGGTRVTLIPTLPKSPKKPKRPKS